MIKIGNEKLFSMTEILDGLRERLMGYRIHEIRGGRCEQEILAIAAAIGETPDFVRGFVTANRE